MVRSVGVPVVAAILVAAAGCTVQATVPPPEQVGSGAPPLVQPSGHFRFGQTYDQGAVRTTIGAPREFTTSQFAMPEQGPAWAVDATFTNDSARPMPLSAMHFSATTEGRVGQQVIDPQQGFQGVMMAPVLAPGQTVTMPLAWTGSGSAHEVTVASQSGETAVSWSE